MFVVNDGRHSLERQPVPLHAVRTVHLDIFTYLKDDDKRAKLANTKLMLSDHSTQLQIT